MAARSDRASGKGRPRLAPGMKLADFDTYYWLMEDLVAFARELGLPRHGNKPELTQRIRRHLSGDARSREEIHSHGVSIQGPRDSDKPLTRDTPVVNYKSDEKTREFFKSEIGPEFHFTYFLNQYRLRHEGLTYGDLIDEWLAERERRKNKDYKPRLAKHGEYNRFVRDFFADEENEGKTMRQAAAGWIAVKHTADRQYRRRTHKESAGKRERNE